MAILFVALDLKKVRNNFLKVNYNDLINTYLQLTIVERLK